MSITKSEIRTLDVASQGLVHLRHNGGEPSSGGEQSFNLIHCEDIQRELKKIASKYPVLAERIKPAMDAYQAVLDYYYKSTPPIADYVYSSGIVGLTEIIDLYGLLAEHADVASIVRPVIVTVDPPKGLIEGLIADAAKTPSINALMLAMVNADRRHNHYPPLTLDQLGDLEDDGFAHYERLAKAILEIL